MIPFSSGSLLLAPMVGITNRAFRTLVGELGAPNHCFTEMASAEAFISGALYEDVYTDPSPDPEHTSVQFSARSARSAQAACDLLAKRSGAGLPQGVDLNFGCSAPHIRKAGGGSAWSADPEGAALLVSQARASWPGLLSAKVRLGADEDYGRILDYAKRLSDAGLDFLVVHPRTDRQKFKGKPRHEVSFALARDLSIPVIANGDICTMEDVQNILGSGSIHSVMLGREAVRRPWIFRKLKRAGTNAPIDRLEVGLRFLGLVEDLLPRPWQLETARRFFFYYCDPLRFAHHARTSLMNSADLALMRTTLEKYFADSPEDRFEDC